MELFGFKITRALNQSGSSDGFTAPSTDDGTLDVISGGGHYASILDMDVCDRNELDLMRRYRDIAQQPECDSAIEDIVNERLSLMKETICFNVPRQIRPFCKHQIENQR